MPSTNPPYTEEALVGLLKQKDKAAFSVLYDNYSAALYGVVYKIVANEELARDVLQEAFVKIWKNSEKYDRGKGSLYTWMLNIARNSAIDKLRSKHLKYNIQTLDEGVYRAKGTSTDPNTDRIGLREIVEGLDPRLREVIELAYFGGLTQDEISQQLEIPLGTVKTRARKALQELRKYFN